DAADENRTFQHVLSLSLSHTHKHTHTHTVHAHTNTHTPSLSLCLPAVVALSYIPCFTHSHKHALAFHISPLLPITHSSLFLSHTPFLSIYVLHFNLQFYPGFLYFSRSLSLSQTQSLTPLPLP